MITDLRGCCRWAAGLQVPCRVAAGGLKAGLNPRTAPKPTIFAIILPQKVFFKLAYRGRSQNIGKKINGKFISDVN